MFLNVLASMQQFNTFYKLVSFEEFIELIILWKKSDAFGERKKIMLGCHIHSKILGQNTYFSSACFLHERFDLWTGAQDSSIVFKLSIDLVHSSGSSGTLG